MPTARKRRAYSPHTLLPPPPPPPLLLLLLLLSGATAPSAPTASAFAFLDPFHAGSRASTHRATSLQLHASSLIANGSASAREIP